MTKGCVRRIPVRFVAEDGVENDLDNDGVDRRIAQLTRLAKKVFRRQDKATR